MSLHESGLMEAVCHGPYKIIDRESAKTPEEQRQLYGKIACCDYFLMSTNAITMDGELVNIVERLKIFKTPDGPAYTEDDGQTFVHIPEDNLVSMNFFGFTPSLFPILEQRFPEFLHFIFMTMIHNYFPPVHPIYHALIPML